MLALHHDIGTPDRLAFYDQLAERFTVLVPRHPGWGRSQRPAWARHVRDLAAVHQWLLAELDIPHCALVGLGFGGWIAADMASLSPRQFSHLILAGAMGIKPPSGEIMDQAVISYLDYPKAGFHDEAAFRRIYGDVSTDQLEAWDIAREMCFRVAWKPYTSRPTTDRRVKHSAGRYKTLSAANAAAALELLRTEDRVDVMFSDVIMPGGMNGLQLSSEARRLRPGLKVLLNSGYAPTIFGGTVSQDTPLITKPYNQTDLAARLTLVLSM